MIVRRVLLRGVNNTKSLIPDLLLISDLTMMKTAVFLLQAVSKTLLDGYEGSDKKKASKALVDNVSTYLLKVHDGLNLDEGSRAEVLCSGAAEIVKIFCRQDGLGRMSGFVLAMVEFSCRQSLPSCNGLLTEVCLQLDSFDSSSNDKDNWTREY